MTLRSVRSPIFRTSTNFPSFSTAASMTFSHLLARGNERFGTACRSTSSKSIGSSFRLRFGASAAVASLITISLSGVGGCSMQPIPVHHGNHVSLDSSVQQLVGQPGVQHFLLGRLGMDHALTRYTDHPLSGVLSEVAESLRTVHYQLQVVGITTTILPIIAE